MRAIYVAGIAVFCLLLNTAEAGLRRDCKRACKIALAECFDREHCAPALYNCFTSLGRKPAKCRKRLQKACLYAGVSVCQTTPPTTIPVVPPPTVTTTTAPVTTTTQPPVSVLDLRGAWHVNAALIQDTCLAGSTALLSDTLIVSQTGTSLVIDTVVPPVTRFTGSVISSTGFDAEGPSACNDTCCFISAIVGRDIVGNHGGFGFGVKGQCGVLTCNVIYAGTMDR